MDEIGNYLYIIVFAGIIIFNILKAFRKQQEPVPSPDFPENHSYSTDDEKDSWENPVSVFQREPITYQSMQKSKVEPTIKAEQRTQENLLNENEEDKNISVAFSNTDDARQAFIYSEIWNRKYSV